MNSPVGIRREDKNKFEARVPITPTDVAGIIKETGARFIIQPSEIRVFTDDEYRNAGAEIAEDISSCPIVFAVKEISAAYFIQGHTYIFFSHTVKGQEYNMAMLKRMMELKCNLIDYERVADEKNRRLIFFGRYAGLAGMIDTLWSLGQRLEAEGIDNPFTDINNTYRYENLEEAKKQITKVGNIIRNIGLPENIAPLVTGFAGYGNVSLGAQEIYDLLPVREVAPEQLPGLYSDSSGHSNHLYKVVFKEEDMVEPVDTSARFELQDYYDYPEKYRSRFEKYIPFMTVLVNCIYWDTMYPRLLTREYARSLYTGRKLPRLKVIGDISCDIEGSIELTVKVTEPDKPSYLYDVNKNDAVDAFSGNGPIIMAVDNLPCELPREASEEFSKVLKLFTPAVINADFSKPFEESGLPGELKRAAILYHGELTPEYRFMEKFLK